jgi:hypothetical protein
MTNTFVTHGGAANVRNRVEAAWINSHGTKVSALRKKFTRCGGDPINLAPLKLDKNTSRIVPGVSTGACWRPPYYTGITCSITIARNTDSRVAESIRSTQRKATTRLTSQARSVLRLVRSPAHSLLPSSLYLDHSHCLVLAPATLAALPSTRAIETRLLPSSLAATHRGPAAAGSLSPNAPFLLATCSMSRVPRAPFTKAESSAYAPASASIMFPGYRLPQSGLIP